MSKFLGVLLVIVLVALAGGGAYAYYSQSKKIDQQKNDLEEMKTKLDQLKTNEASEGESGLAQTYRDEENKYSIGYPEGYTTSASKNDDDPNQISTVNFKDEKGTTIVTLLVQPKDLEGMLKETFEIEKTSAAVIGQKTGEKLEVKDNKDGKDWIYYLVTKGEKQYVIKGLKANIETLEQMIETFTFLP
jgi:predicted ribosomally synthesized peptide with SipW-like signal peptide